MCPDSLARVEVVMPQLGVSISEGTVTDWAKAVGDRVEADEPLCTISTDKVDSDVPSPAAGVLHERLVDAGETVPVGTVLAVVEIENGVTPEHRPTAAGEAPAADGDRRRRFSPVVRRIGEVHGIDPRTVSGTGRNGRVTKADMLAAVEAREPKQDAPPAERSLPGAAPLSPMRRSIAEHMTRSLATAAHCTTISEADLTGLERARAALGVTYLPIVAHCLVATLRELPYVNAWLDDDMLTVHTEVHLGIAVSLGDDGLIVPVIRNAEGLSVDGLARAIRDLGGRARSGALAPDDLSGGTFTITSPGEYGALAATPIINQPQVAILDFESVVKRPVVVKDRTGADAIAIRPMSYLCLSWDHRALDGVAAARFLRALRGRIESFQAS